MLKRKQSAERSEEKFTKEAAERVLQNVFEISGRTYRKKTAASLRRTYAFFRALYLSAGIIVLAGLALLLGRTIRPVISWDVSANAPYERETYREAPVPKEGEAVVPPMIVEAYIEGSNLMMNLVQGTYEVDGGRFYAMERGTKEKVGVSYDREQYRLTIPYDGQSAVYDIYLFDTEGYSYIVTVTVG